MNRQNRIKLALETNFRPTFLEVSDESHKHAGHSGASPLGETHYHIVISSESFKGKTRVNQHRLINTAIAEEFTTGLHALSIEIK